MSKSLIPLDCDVLGYNPALKTEAILAELDAEIARLE